MTIKRFENKRIVLGVTGGIAAYKAATVCSRLVQSGAHVDVIMTDAAQRFVTPLTFQALTHRGVYTNMWDIPPGQNIPHISLADNTDLLLIAPATSNTIARIANGFADDLLAAVALATPAPMLLAPAMETDMWVHPATQVNVQKLKAWGVHFVGPAEGRLASGAMGKGRMVEPDDVIGAARLVLGKLTGSLANLKVVITAGGTREAIDPVRYISNHSSGKMGYALAEVARDRGAAVTLITTVDQPALYGVNTVSVNTAEEMLNAVLESTKKADILVMSAAVADFRPATVAEQKIKKQDDMETMSIELTRNPDILAQVAAQRDDGHGPRVTVGFAAESENLIRNAEVKLKNKRLNLIAANDITAKDAGFGADTNRVTLLSSNGSVEELGLMSKHEVAERIFDRLSGLSRQ